MLPVHSRWWGIRALWGPYYLPVPWDPEGPSGSKTAALPHSVGFSHLSVGYLDPGLRTSLTNEGSHRMVRLLPVRRAFVSPSRERDV